MDKGIGCLRGCVHEANLIQMAAKRDEQAWETLLQKHQEAVFRLAYLFMSDADEAEDIAQDTFLRAYRFIHTFDSSRSFRPWLLSITANLARNCLRSLRRYLGALQRFAHGEPQPVPSLRESEDEAQQLWEQIRRMRLEDQQVLYLRYFLELSDMEISVALSIPVGTVKSRLHRALGRLRSQMARETPGPGETKDGEHDNQSQK